MSILTFKTPTITRECFPHLPEFQIREWVKSAAWFAACIAVCAFGVYARFYM